MGVEWGGNGWIKREHDQFPPPWRYNFTYIYIYKYIIIYYIYNGLEQPCIAPTCEADFLAAAGAARRAAEVIGWEELQNHTTTRSGTWSKPDFEIKYVNMSWATSIELHKGSTKRRRCHAVNFNLADLQLAVNCLATVGARNSQLDLRFRGSSRFAYLELNKLRPGSKKTWGPHTNAIPFFFAYAMLCPKQIQVTLEPWLQLLYV